MPVDASYLSFDTTNPGNASRMPIIPKRMAEKSATLKSERYPLIPAVLNSQPKDKLARHMPSKVDQKRVRVWHVRPAPRLLRPHSVPSYNEDHDLTNPKRGLVIIESNDVIVWTSSHVHLNEN